MSTSSSNSNIHSPVPPVEPTASSPIQMAEQPWLPGPLDGQFDQQKSAKFSEEMQQESV